MITHGQWMQGFQEERGQHVLHGESTVKVVKFQTFLFLISNKISNRVKLVLSGYSKKDRTNVLMANGSLMKVESIAECSHWSILQYF